MRTAFLRGRDHTRLGSISAHAEGRAAIAISRGGSPKMYPHTDPNEDAAILAEGPGGVLVAVADAHHGFVAAEISLDSLLAQPAEQWTLVDPIQEGTWTRHALAALAHANTAIRRRVEGTPPPRSATTLALALVRPREKLLLYAAIGDSHLFQVNMDSVVDRARSTRAKSFFLGWGDEKGSSLGDKCLIGIEPLAKTRAVVLATDGLSERHIGVKDPGAAVTAVVERAARATPDHRPLEAARGVVETALEAQRRQGSGDNVASAVVWLEGEAG